MRKLLLALLSLALTFGVEARIGDKDHARLVYTYSMGQPIGMAPTGTMGANGALTSGTALPATYSGGIWLYFPAGAVFSGSSAGFFWCVMSTTTAGTCYQDTYTYNSTNPLSIPASPTAVSDAGPGAYTGVTSAINVLGYAIPGGIIGNNGWIVTSFEYATTSNANTKTLNHYIDAASCYGYGAGSQAGQRGEFIAANRNSAARQVCMSNSSSTGMGVATPLYLTKNTATSLTHTFAITRGTATDAAVLEGVHVTVFYAP